MSKFVRNKMVEFSTDNGGGNAYVEAFDRGGAGVAGRNVETLCHEVGNAVADAVAFVSHYDEAMV